MNLQRNSTTAEDPLTFRKWDWGLTAANQIIDHLACFAVVVAAAPFIDFATPLLSNYCDIYHSVYEGTL